MQDQELRDRFDEWARPLRTASPPGIPALRQRARRRRTRLVAAGASACAVAAIVMGLASSGVFGGRQTAAGPVASHPVTSPTPGQLTSSPPAGRSGFWGGPPAARYPSPPGAPYLVVHTAGLSYAEVIDEPTGQLLKTIRPLAQGSFFTSIAAAGTDRLFVLAQQTGLQLTSFAELRISASGQVQLSPVLPNLTLSMTQIYAMTVNPAGTRVVLSTVPVGGHGPGTLLSYDLTSGALLGSWPVASGGVDLSYWPAADQLAISWQAGAGQAASGLRILDTASASPANTTLLADTRPGPALAGYGRGTLTADGSVALHVTQSGATMQLQEFSAASGRLERTIALGPASALHSTGYCGVLWASPSGDRLLTQCGTQQQVVSGATVVRTRFAVIIPVAQAGGIASFAW
jgi:hypothetical protein